MGEKVCMDGPAGVVTGENGVELDNAAGIGLLNSSQISGVVSTRSVVSGG